MLWIKERSELREEERKIRASFTAAQINLHLPKRKQIKPHDLYGAPPKTTLTLEELEALRKRIGPDSIPVDLEKLRTQRRLN